MISFADYWRESLRKNAADYPDMLSWDPYERWSTNLMPQNTAESRLVAGLEILFGGNRDLGLQFFKMVGQIADRIIGEDKLRSKPCNAYFPANLGVLKRTVGIARSVSAERTATEEFREAALAFESWCGRLNEWSDVSENFLLSGVRAALIAEEWLVANRLLGMRNLPKHRKQVELLREVLASGKAGAKPGQTLVGRYGEYFDFVRDPKYDHKKNAPLEVTIAPFEIGLVRDKFIVSETRTIDWPRAVAAFAA